MAMRRMTLGRLDLRFAAAFSAAAAVVLLAAWLLPLPAQTVVHGLLLALILAAILRQSRWSLPEGADAELLTLPLALARDEDVFEAYRQIAESLREVSGNPDPIYRKLSLQRTGELAHELGQIAAGRIVFIGTETWRMVYAQLLRSPGLHLYRSVALVKTANYWQDEPGRQSTRLNLELTGDARINIERIIVVADPLWPAVHSLPLDPLQGWIDAQHRRGISLKLVRLSAIAGEPDLAADFGIYGNRAVGYQELDEHGRTVRFTLSFNFDEVLAAEERWERLSVYAAPYGDLLGQPDGA